MLSLRTDHDSAALLFRSSADDLAARNFSANLRALAIDQPDVVQDAQSLPAAMTWIFGRDGALTAHGSDGRWLADCSLPLLAARAMLASLKLTGTTGCFLAPAHAAQIVAAFEHVEPEQAIIVVMPDAPALRIALSCEDFSELIESRRLWFVCGPQWSEMLDGLLKKQTGLPTPTQFIRMPTLDQEMMDQLVAPAQRIFIQHNAHRSERIHELIAHPAAGERDGICLIAPSRFELWNDAGVALAEQLMPKCAAMRFDPTHTAEASPLALAEKIANARAVVSASLARSDVPDVAPLDLPWITWITSSRIPRPTSNANRDALILADPQYKPLARQAGWDQRQLFVGGWPSIPPTAEAALAISLIADVRPTCTPDAETMPLSSHRLMWDHIRQELSADPLAIGNDAAAFLRRRASQFAIDEASLDQDRFFVDLILPAYQSGLARLLLHTGLPLRLYGRGWNESPDLAGAHHGYVTSRQELADILSISSAAIHPSPLGQAHGIDGSPRPVIRAAGMTRQSLLAQLRQFLDQAPPPPPRPTPPINLELIQRILQP